MNVAVRLFAVLRERAGSNRIEIDLPVGSTVADALTRLRSDARLATVLEDVPVVMAVNREYANEQTPLAEDDELALLPPVSGGGEYVAHARVTEEPLSVEALIARVASPRAGGTVTFSGTTRDIPALHYEAYAEMAEERIAAIVVETIERHELEAAAAEHRVGEVALGEPSVIVAASAAHREQAFAGARELIDRIKAEAPIWKRERESGDWIAGVIPPII